MFVMYVLWSLVGIFAVVGGFVFVCKAIDYAIQFAIMKIKFHGDEIAYCKWAEANYW